MTQKPSLVVTFGQASTTGVKEENDDCLGIRIPDEDDSQLRVKGAVMAMADGASTAQGGGEVAELCVQGFLNDYYDTPDAWKVSTAGHRILSALNRWLFSLGQGYEVIGKGYVSTFSTVVVKSRTAYIFHVGDTRIWLLRNGELRQITRDHSIKVTSGRTQLTRGMGLDLSLDIDYHELALKENDLLIISSDGLHEYVSQKSMCDTLLANRSDLQKGCQELVDLAKSQDSPDNISCQALNLIHLSEGDAGDIYRALSKRPFPPELYPGMTIDGYEVELEIQASKRSQVYKVRDVESGEVFIMKTPSVSFEDDPAYIERFTTEKWVSNKIDSPNVVKSVTEKREPQFLYNLYEFVNGDTLEKWMEQNPQAEMKVIVGIAKGIIKGLRAFHRKEILHQDLKPSNIMISENMTPVIIDFGSCMVSGLEEISYSYEREKILGTDQYTAPEYLLGVKPNSSSDQYSLATIIYQMMTGKLPYGKYDSANSLRDFCVLKYTPSYLHNPMVPTWMDGALKKALDIHSENRHDSLSSLEYDLSHPNLTYLSKEPLGYLLNRSTLFWKCLSVGLLITQAITLYFLTK